MPVDIKPYRDEWLPDGHIEHMYVDDPTDIFGPCLHEYSNGVCLRPSYWAGHVGICEWRGWSGSCGHYKGHDGKHSSEHSFDHTRED